MLTSFSMSRMYPKTGRASNHDFVIKEGLTSYSLDFIGFFAAKNPMKTRL